MLHRSKFVLMIFLVGQAAVAMDFNEGSEGRGGGGSCGGGGGQTIECGLLDELRSHSRVGGGEAYRPELVANLQVELMKLLGADYPTARCNLENPGLELRLEAARSVSKAARFSDEIQRLSSTLGKLICHQPVVLGINQCLGTSPSSEGHNIVYLTARPGDNRHICISENYNQLLQGAGASTDRELSALNTYLDLAFAISSGSESSQMKARLLLNQLVKRGYK